MPTIFIEDVLFHYYIRPFHISSCSLGLDRISEGLLHFAYSDSEREMDLAI